MAWPILRGTTSGPGVERLRTSLGRGCPPARGATSVDVSSGRLGVGRGNDHPRVRGSPSPPLATALGTATAAPTQAVLAASASLH
eukprot:5644058-Pyramimonas_sp.AAC.1